MDLSRPWVGSISPADFPDTETVQSASRTLYLRALKILSNLQKAVIVACTNKGFYFSSEIATCSQWFF